MAGEGLVRLTLFRRHQWPAKAGEFLRPCQRRWWLAKADESDVFPEASAAGEGWWALCPSGTAHGLCPR